MKYLSFILILVCLPLTQGFSQVKKQYKDVVHAETTVVVKENNVNDLAILNSQFNLNDVGMGEVIMIKTENLKSKGKTEQPAAKPKPVQQKMQPAKTVATPPKKSRYSSNYRGVSHKVKTKKKRLKKRKRIKRGNRLSCFKF